MKYRALIVLIPLMLLISCSSTPEVTSPTTPADVTAPTNLPPPTPTNASPPPTPTNAPLPTEPPTPTSMAMAAEPESPIPTPTTEPKPAEPPSPTPTVLPPTNTSPPAPQTGGTAGFRDNLATADQFILQLTDVPAPPDGQAYQGWLLNGDGATTSVGLLNLTPDGSVTLEWNSPNSENLLSLYSRFQVTLEPAAGSAGPTGEIIFAGEPDTKILANAQRLFVRNDGEPATPLDTAFALGLIAQTNVAAQHVQNAVNAAAIGALPEMRSHLEHIVNILEGTAGPRFGDHNGNGTAENPGDGFGVIGYSKQIAELSGNRETIVQTAADVQTQGIVIQDKCLEILKFEDMAAATAQLQELKGLADQFQAGPVAGLYQAAQDIASFEVISVK